MLRPVKDPQDPNHFLKAEYVREHINDKKLSFEDLKKELPKLKGRSDTSAEFNADKERDKQNGTQSDTERTNGPRRCFL